MMADLVVWPLMQASLCSVSRVSNASWSLQYKSFHTSMVLYHVHLLLDRERVFDLSEHGPDVGPDLNTTLML